MGCGRHGSWGDSDEAFVANWLYYRLIGQGKGGCGEFLSQIKQLINRDRLAQRVESATTVLLDKKCWRVAVSVGKSGGG